MKEDTIPETMDQIEDLEIEREVECIDFEIGDNVVYPHHGAGQVIKKEDKNILGEVRQYLTIKILHNDMTVMVPCENAGKAGPPPRHRRGDRQEGARRALRRHLRDAEELEPALQAQPRQDQDRRHLRARRGGSQPRHPRAGQGPVDGREADVHAGEEDPRLRADVRAGEDRGRGRGVPRPDPDARERWPPPADASEHAGSDARPLRGRCEPRLVRRSGRRSRRSSSPAGSGERLGAGRPKAFVVLAGRPMAAWSLDAIAAAGIPRAVVAVPPGHGAAAEEALGGAAGDFPLGLAFVEGGATRSASVRNALAAAGDAEAVVVHDAARPLATPELFTRTLAALADADAAIAAARVTDTVKEAGPDGRRRAHARPLAPVGDPDAAGVPRGGPAARARRPGRRARRGHRRRLARRARRRHACAS